MDCCDCSHCLQLWAVENTTADRRFAELAERVIRDQIIKDMGAAESRMVAVARSAAKRG